VNNPPERKPIILIVDIQLIAVRHYLGELNRADALANLPRAGQIYKDLIIEFTSWIELWSIGESGRNLTRGLELAFKYLNVFAPLPIPP